MNVRKATGVLFIVFTLVTVSGAGGIARASTNPGAANPGDDTIGQLYSYTVEPKETLYDIARRYDLGIVALRAANPKVNPWKPKPGTTLLLPAMHILPTVAHEGIVINLAERRLYAFDAEGKVLTFPVAIGMTGWETPTGNTKIMLKRKNPTWTPTDSIREQKPDLPQSIGPGPDNPLGDRAMYLGWTGYLIHGTNSPRSIGTAGTHGCIRLYPEDIETLFDAVEKDTHVTVIDAPYKLGWWQDKLLLQVLPAAAAKPPAPKPVAVGTAADGTTGAVAEAAPKPAKKKPPVAVLVRAQIKEMAGPLDIDWDSVNVALKKHNGIPVIIADRHVAAAAAASAPVTAPAAATVTQSVPAATPTSN